jgi:hypothetical protein
MSFIPTSKDYFKNYLAKPAGVPEDRFKAFELPSLVNGKQIPATRIKAGLVGGPRFYNEVDNNNYRSIK